MLANLLPGIRDLRTPLATGYIWLLTFWLWIPSHFKHVPPTSGVPGDVTHLVHYAGRVGVGVAISFVAYLIGILSQALNSPFSRLGTLNVYLPSIIQSRINQLRNWLNRLRERLADDLRFTYSRTLHYVSFALASRRRRIYPAERDIKIWDFWRRSFTYPADSGKDDRDEAELAFMRRIVIVVGQFSRTGVYSLEDFSRQMADRGEIKNDAQTKYLNYLLQEVPRQGNALVGKETELYSVYDRLISEYEFRISIAVPLTALIVTLADRWSLLWLLTLLPVLVLLRTGTAQRIAAGDLLADAVRLRRIDVAIPRDLAATSTLSPVDQDDRPSNLPDDRKENNGAGSGTSAASSEKNTISADGSQ